MTVGISKVRRPQFAFAIPGDHSGLHLEGNTSIRHLGVGGPNVLDLDHELGQRLILHRLFDPVEDQLRRATSEEHKGAGVHHNFEPDLVFPEPDGALEIADSEDYASNLHLGPFER